MRAESINPPVSVGSFTTGGDPIALLQAIFAAGAHEMRNAAVTYSDHASQRLSLLSQMRSVQDQLTAAAATPAGDGKTVVLGSTLEGGKALKTQIEALDHSLTTEERYNLSSEVTDKAGKVLSTGAKHIATAAEMKAAEAGKLVSGPTTAGVETRSVTAADGSTTTYTLYTKERSITATAAAVTALKDVIAARIGSLELEVSFEAARAVAFANSIVNEEQNTDRLFKNARKQEAAAQDNNQLDKHQTTDESIVQRVRHRRELEQHQNMVDSHRRG